MLADQEDSLFKLTGVSTSRPEGSCMWELSQIRKHVSKNASGVCGAGLREGARGSIWRGICGRRAARHAGGAATCAAR